jgi:hypothetical protein
VRFSNAKSIRIYHLPTTGGETQPYTPDVTTSGAVLPLDRRDAALVGVDLVDPWEIYLDPTVDVRENDKLIIDGDSNNYYVVHIFKANFGGLAHQRVTISRKA